MERTPVTATAYPHIHRLRFTLSASPYTHTTTLLSDNLLDDLKRLAPKIYDLNVTCRVPPFDRDAHGLALDPMKAEMHLRDMLELQKLTGVTISALFNNIYVPPTLENLRTFVAGFRRLYDLGVRSATIPHTLWMKWGLLQKEFPQLSIKNTVLRKIRTGQDFWNSAEAGFDYVNLDRLLLRDERTLREIRRAQELFEHRYGKRVLLSILANERCLGKCPFWEEHYQHTMTHPDGDLFDEMPRVSSIPRLASCSNDPQSAFFRTYPPIFREDFEHLAQYVDVLKMAGRTVGNTLQHSLSRMKDFLESSDDLLTSIYPWASQLRPLFRQSTGPLRDCLDQWRSVTRQCRFQCWSCDLCERLEALCHQPAPPVDQPAASPVT